LPSRQSPLSATMPSAGWRATGLTVTLTCADRCKVSYRAYTIESGELVAGRTGICDGYLFLVGKPDKRSIAGSFRATGLGYSEKLGDFDLTVVP